MSNDNSKKTTTATPSRLTTALTTATAAPKGGGLMRALGGAATPAAIPAPKTMDVKTQQALAAAQQRQKERSAMALVFDATASREDMWEQVIGAQKNAYREAAKLGPLRTRLAYFNGDGVHDRGAFDDAEKLCSDMGRARCVSGRTQIIPAINTILKSGDIPRVLLYAGDVFEENSSEFTELANTLARMNIKCFMFLDTQSGRDPLAEELFRTMANKTGGFFAILGDKADFGPYMGAAAAYAAGGDAGLLKLAQTNTAAKQIADKVVLRLTHNKPS